MKKYFLGEKERKLLRKVEKHILEEPRRLNMQKWYETGYDLPPCGTTACIAGWTVVLAGVNIEESLWNVEISAMRLLGIPPIIAYHLFFVEAWPAVYRSKYYEAMFNPELKAKVTVDRIEHFIKTGE